MTTIKVERIYTKPEDLSGYRILVDRVWPRGISKEVAHLNQWEKDVAPTTELRKWFNHDPEKYPEFKQRYLDELKANPATPAFVTLVKDQLVHKDVILLFGAKDEQDNQAQVLKDFLETNESES
ncbi:DUF488 domain-containing protein [Levilactobacillus bambusae]|uniref:DUF488 domain-containing protein n=1 Tax=Levilactobacillus bambusae TaxID=2024736 RepID=A0A2V1MYS1_9LACO|nr:DUF488 family protein [Levilactobacillus bambusae]PWG00119.1 DUF488 domain-containing protein [Levilactobacillus bambusae]